MTETNQDHIERRCRLVCRMRRLIGRILDCRVVPFVGAGFSARKPVRKGEFDPSAAEMQRRLEDLIPRDNPTAQRAAAESGAVYVRPRAAQNGAPDRLRRSSAGNSVVKTTSLAKTAEIASWFTTNSEILNAAEIEEFATLAPTDCHRYLAYMAREGWITQVLSTNYDTCIEKAFEESYGAGRSQGAPYPIEKITSLGDYTRYGAEAHRRGEPLLHLYKLNGCAKKFKNKEKGNEILLTERQLQKMRSDGWKHAMLGHVGRTHTLLFSGFGAEEPQIRHTVLALIDDFAADNNHRRTENNDGQQDASQCYEALTEDYDTQSNRECRRAGAACQRPHAPWVTTYDAEPTFPQTQLLMAFVDAYAPSRGGNGRSGSPLDRIYDLVIGGADGPALCDPNWYGRLQEPTQPAPGCDAAHPTLPADLLWKRLYQLAMAQRLARDVEDSPLFGWLRDTGVDVLGARTITRELKRWIETRASDNDFDRPVTRWWERVSRPSSAPNGNGTASNMTGAMPLLWMQLLSNMELLDSRTNGDIYYPYRADRLGWWITLALVYFLSDWLGTGPADYDMVDGIGPMWGLDDATTDATRGPAIRFVLVSDKSGLPVTTMLSEKGMNRVGAGTSRRIIRILVPMGRDKPPRGRFEQRSEDHGLLRTGEYVAISAARMFSGVIWPCLRYHTYDNLGRDDLRRVLIVRLRREAATVMSQPRLHPRLNKET